jgi:hypothetical protein
LRYSISLLALVLFATACNGQNSMASTVTVAPIYIETSTLYPALNPTQTAAETPIMMPRAPTFPFGDASHFQYKESDCMGSTYEMMFCVSGKAYEAARELDALLSELDNQFPDRSWELALHRIILPQEKWESLKQPYCEYVSQKFIGGTAHSNSIMNCIAAQNKERIEILLWAICFENTMFSKCPPRKPGGEEPSITAIPLTPTP